MPQRGGVLVPNRVLMTVGIALPACKLTFIFSTETVSSLSNGQHVNMNTCTNLIPRLTAYS